MAKSTTFAPVSPDKLAKGVAPPAKELQVKFPNKATGTGLQGESAVQGWLTTHPVPAPPTNPTIAIKPIPVTSKALGHIQAIADSASAPGEMLNRMDTDTFVGTLYSALVTAQYLKARGAYAKVEAQNDPEVKAAWTQVVAGHVKAFEAVGLKGLTEKDLDNYAKVLSSNADQLNAVMRISNSAVVEKATANKMVASFVADTRVLPSIDRIHTAIPNLCSTPFATGTYTRHFHQGFSWQVSIPYPCWDTCHKKIFGVTVSYPCNFHMCSAHVTVAGVSFDLDLNVGYNVNCCGASAWGQASVQACATVLGAKACATCTATIVGLVGVSRTPAGSGCSYGLGVTASLECKVAGQTVFFASVPFGWTVTGPCPPAGIKC